MDGPAADAPEAAQAPEAAHAEPETDGGYALLDAGGGRRLERFGGYAVDRPAPQASEPVRAPQRWAEAQARFERGVGWSVAEPVPGPWLVELERLTFELRLTASGQVGVFPEQAPNWRWIAEQVGARIGARAAADQAAAHVGEPAAASPGAQRVLDLFAYTGGATLAAARAGAQVTHVDAVRSAIGWARRNAAASGLEAAPIRWIPDDAVRFAEREVRRGRAYDLVVLDPPSYGQGPAGERWRLVDRLPGLLTTCARLLTPEPIGLLLSAHTAGLGPEDLAAAVAAALGRRGRIEALPLTLTAESGARLALGAVARWTP